MAVILSINESEAKIGEDNGEVFTVPLAALQFANPQVNEKVDLYRDGENFLVRRRGEVQPGGAAPAGTRSMNKHVFVWVGNFLFGGLGVDRFMRGQVGLGILKLLLSTLGWIVIVGGFAGWIWTLVDWVISMIKAYGSAYGSVENITFDAHGHYTN